MPLKGIITRAVTSLALRGIPFASSQTQLNKVEQISVGGSERKYIVSRPAAPHACPTIFVLHGSFANAQMAMLGMGFEALVEREQLAAVYPDAVAMQWNDGHAPSIAWGGRRPPDDVEFLRALATHLVRIGVSDTNRIYVTGFSSGGMMAFRLMCEAPGVFAAIAPIAATLPAELFRSCKTKPTPTLLINGTADSLVPFAGRKFSFAGRRVPSNDETIRFLRKVNGCTDTVKIDRLPPVNGSDASSVVIASWTSCSSAAPVVLYRIEGGGHRIPSRGEGVRFVDVVLGKMNHDFETTEVIWSFFKDRTL
jgi:polyhydroxybutyrate depolymerase